MYFLLDPDLGISSIVEDGDGRHATGTGLDAQRAKPTSDAQSLQRHTTEPLRQLRSGHADARRLPVDLYSEYRLDANWKVFARGENILNERYQEVLNFGTTGPALYAGFNATW